MSFFSVGREKKSNTFTGTKKLFYIILLTWRRKTYLILYI